MDDTIEFKAPSGRSLKLSRGEVAVTARLIGGLLAACPGSFTEAGYQELAELRDLLARASKADENAASNTANERLK